MCNILTFVSKCTSFGKFLSCHKEIDDFNAIPRARKIFICAMKISQHSFLCLPSVTVFFFFAMLRKGVGAPLRTNRFITSAVRRIGARRISLLALGTEKRGRGRFPRKITSRDAGAGRGCAIILFYILIFFPNGTRNERENN